MGNKAYTSILKLPKEVFQTGITDASTHNQAMDIIDTAFVGSLNWKAPVANVGALPAVGNIDGDARVVLANAEIYVWVLALGGWQSATIGGDPHWKAPVATPLALPVAGNNNGDVRVVLSEFAAYVWNGAGWQYLVALDKTHEAYAFGRNAAVTNAYIRTSGNVPSNLTGYPMRTNALLIGVAFASSGNSNCVVEIWNKGVAIIDSLPIVNATYGAKVSSIAVTAGMQISCRINGTANRPVVTVIVE